MTKRFFSFAEIIDREIKNGRLEVVIQSGATHMEALLKDNGQGSIGAVIIDCTDFALDENSIAAELFTP